MLLNDVHDALPVDGESSVLIGRLYDPAERGPSVVSVRGQVLADLTDTTPTVTDLLESADPAALAREAPARKTWPLDDVLTNTLDDAPRADIPVLLAPADLQVLKAAGVTFATSLLERVIEERAAGDPSSAESVRAEIEKAIGTALTTIVPGSPEAMSAKQWLRQRGLWSQYLEVGLGPDPEVFTKAPVLSAVGLGSEVGVPEVSQWNNPEPEIVLAVNSSGRIIGATLGNDVNLRDVEGRSALLLPQAKDNNASAAVGPFLRLFDERFHLDAVRSAEVHLEVHGQDGYVLTGTSSMREISRDPEDLVASVLGPHHQYPDGFLLYTGTLFAPTQDRGVPGSGFTHHLGDVVRISSPRLGALVNVVNHAEKAAPWIDGVRALMGNLAARGLLGGPVEFGRRPPE